MPPKNCRRAPKRQVFDAEHKQITHVQTEKCFTHATVRENVGYRRALAHLDNRQTARPYRGALNRTIRGQCSPQPDWKQLVGMRIRWRCKNPLEE